MRKLVLTMFMSLDGFIEGPGKTFVGPRWSDDMQVYWSDINLGRAGALVYGRVAYQFNAQFWPTMGSNPDASQPTRDNAAVINALPKLVLSRTLTQGDWGPATFVGDDVVGAVTALKQQDGKDVVALGGAGMAQTLMAAGLVDEYRILVAPMVLGGGTPLFGPGFRQKLDLIELKRLDTGSFIISYRPAA
jgi:dihydrofolate reductase